MRLSTPAALLSLTSLTFATPVPQYDNGSGVNNPYYQWQVTGWNAGCAHSGCSYDFNVTGYEFGSNPTLPAFSSYCSSFGEGSPFAACKNLDGSSAPSVAAKLLLVNETGTGAHLAVSLQFNVGEGAYYNYTGYTVQSYNAFVAPAAAFLIEPSEAFGVA